MDRKLNHPLEKRLVRINLKFQQLFIYRVIQRTVLTIFPFVLIGSFAKMLQILFFTKNGFLTRLTDPLNETIYNQLDRLISVIANLTINWVAIIAVFAAAKYTAKHFHRDDQIAGITGIISILIISYTYSKKFSLSFHPSVLGIRGLLFAIFLGIFVGYMFKLTSKENHKSRFAAMSASVLNRAFISIKSILVVIIISTIVSAVVNVTFYSDLPNNVIYALSTSSMKNQPGWLLLRTISMGAYTVLMSFLGWSGPYSGFNNNVNDAASAANLNYALLHHTSWGAPNLFTSSTLYHSFALYGGPGATLALLLAIFWVSRDNDFLTVSRWSLLPSIFNLNSPLMSGIPIFFNIIFLIPFILAPVVNMLIAALALQLHLMPPVVYTVPIGTPGPLIAFLGTNGSWQALAFTLLTLFISTLIYIPFVRIAEQVKILDNLATDDGGVNDEK